MNKLVRAKTFTRIQERIVRTKILSGSIFEGRLLDTPKFEINIGVNVMAIRNGQELFTNSEITIKLREGAILIARRSDGTVLGLDSIAKGALKAVPRPKT